jgi:hypothetical protein
VRGRGSGRLRLQVLPDASRRAERLRRRQRRSRHDRAHRRLVRIHRPRGGRLRSPAPQAARPPRRPPVRVSARDRAISNLKTWLRGTHRGASPDHFQVYLYELVFRHNRRHSPLAAFQTLLGLTSPPAHDLPRDHRSRAPTRDGADRVVMRHDFPTAVGNGSSENRATSSLLVNQGRRRRHAEGSEALDRGGAAP